MDHITLPLNSALPPRVPYLVGTTQYCYEGSDFASYPARVGVDISLIHDLQSLGEHAAFLQQWLFFGMLRHILGHTSGVTIDTEEFVTTESNGERFITTEKLFKYLWYWTAGECEKLREDDLKVLATPGMELDVTNNRRRRDMTVKCLELVCEVTSRLANIDFECCAEDSEESQAQFAGHMVLLSVNILGELIATWAEEVYVRFPYQRENLPWKFGGLMRERLRKAGWCLGELEMLNAQKPGLLWYLSFFDRTHLGKDHSRCSVDICDANQIDISIYRTRHVEEDCCCEYLQAVDDIGNLPISAIVNSDGIPMILIVDTSDGDAKGPRIKTSQTNDQQPYVAISHVWSDGLGNPGKNALPICQLRRLQGLANNLYDPQEWPVPFWIDTICVPLDPATRNRAIRSMAQTYAEADKVLVLDSSLTNIRTETPAPELLIRLSCTTWNQRLWTYQEGILAKQLFFQLSDRAIRSDEVPPPFSENVETLFERAEINFGVIDFVQNPPANRLEERIHRALVAEVLPVYEGQRDMPAAAYEHTFAVVAAFPDCPDKYDEELLFRLERTYEHYIFMDYSGFVGPAYNIAKERVSATVAFVALALNRRLTSRLEDEPVCASVIMGMDPTSIINVKTKEERMKAFWSLFEKVPRDIIFGDIPRLKYKGYNWAPASFMRRGSQLGMGSILHGGHEGQVHGTEGLKVSGLFSYIFPKEYTPKFYLKHEKTCFYFTSITPAGMRAYLRVEICQKWNTFSEERFSAAAATGEKFGLIVGGDKGEKKMPGALIAPVIGNEAAGQPVSGKFWINTMIEVLGQSPPEDVIVVIEGIQNSPSVQWLLW